MWTVLPFLVLIQQGALHQYDTVARHKVPGGLVDVRGEDVVILVMGVPSALLDAGHLAHHPGDLSG
jgi:hypothetical protein